MSQINQQDKSKWNPNKTELYSSIKYFDFKDTSSITITVRGYSGGTYEVKTELDGPTLGKVEIENQNIWHKYKINTKIPDGVHALYLVYTGGGNHQLKCIDIE